nr:hypothetical protein [Methylomarinum sp. Ch1-1]MDP4520326.1 hypothetical protein [Methylomarinum sp. Ch1-1]
MNKTFCFSRRGRRSYAKHRLVFGCVEHREAHQNRCASSRQHTLPAPVGRLREASRQKPPPEAKLVIVVSRRIAWRRITLRLHANVALPSDVLNCVKRIETRCASYRQHTSILWLSDSMHRRLLPANS